MKSVFQMFYRSCLCASLAFTVAGPFAWSADLTRQESPGGDIAEVFARAKAGSPLRYVALGGSITQAGEGWIRPWLEKSFPDSHVTVVNSGMSATGSSLGIFRIERDAIAHQPDLVAIEFCVNDGGLNDEDAIRNMESLIVRLKRLPSPPAIIILEAAARGGVNLDRHRKVAWHYDLVEVDLQKAVNDEMAGSGSPWETYFTDDVHPNAVGNALYAKAIEMALALFLHPPTSGKNADLPPPISKSPLLLDGKMVALFGMANSPGWAVDSFLPQWWGRFFNGAISADKPESVLRLSFRGTHAGILYAMDDSFGSFYANVADGLPEMIFTNSRKGYSYVVLAADLPAREHVLNVVLPPLSEAALRQNGPVKLGYLLLAGETGATNEKGSRGRFVPEVLRSLKLVPVSPEKWFWAGPFLEGKNGEVDARSAMSLVPPLEDMDPLSASWKPLPKQDAAWVDLHKWTGCKIPAIGYLSTTVDDPKGGEVMLALAVDYFAEVWLNGSRVKALDGPHGSATAPVLIPATFQPGKNRILLKFGSGSKGFGFSFSIGRVEHPTSNNSIESKP